MKILYVKSSNYRNLSDLEVNLHETINFIVGENNLGKSNFLRLLNVVFNKHRFEYEDFKEQSQSISITLKLLLDDCEIGNFEDYTDSDNNNRVTIIAKQEDRDTNLEFFHEASGHKINASDVRNLNFVYYDSLRNPIYEISFDKNRGAGTFLNYLIKRKLEDLKKEESESTDTTNEEGNTPPIAQLINNENKYLKDTLRFINDYLQKLKAFKENSIIAKYEEEMIDLLQKLIVLKDEADRGVNKLGYGVQFSMLIALSILEKLVIIYERQNRAFFDYEENDVEGNPISKQAISLVLGLDEPEIHLHPYMQRALVKYLNNIIENKDANFSQILSDVFSIDKINGQIIIVTHSPNILLNDYKQIIRFYQTEVGLGIISNPQLASQEQRHIVLNFPFIKEAFFSRFIIIVEGESELGGFNLFASTMGFNFDELGISVIKSGSDNTIEPLMSVTRKFCINSLGIMDKDKGKTNNNPMIKITNETDFECEIVKGLVTNNEDTLKNIQKLYNDTDYNTPLDINQLKKVCKKYQNDFPTFELDSNLPPKVKLSNINLDDIELKLLWHLTWFERNKSTLLGSVIGTILTIDEIPTIYQEVILYAINESKKQ